MGIKNYLIQRAAKHYQVEDSLAFVDAMGKIGSEAPVAMPTDLLPMAARLFTRGLFTQMAIQPNLDWVLPYWATRQCDPRDVSFIPRMSWSQFNLTHRNWTAVGLPGSTREVVVDPRGWVTPWFDGWSLDVWVELGSDVLYPSREAKCEQRHVDGLPVVLTTFERSQYRLELEALVGQASQLECVFVSAKVINLTDEALAPRLLFSIRPFNGEGGSLVKSIALVDDHTFAINGSLGLQFAARPSLVYCSNSREGDCAFFRNAQQPRPSSECPGGLATAFAAFDLRVDAHGEAVVVASATTEPQPLKSNTVSRMRRYHHADQQAETKAVWKQHLARGLRIDLPDKNLVNAFNLCKCHLMLADDGDHITPGPMTYHHYWFRDSAYMVTALDRMGLHDDARRKLLNYPHRQDRDGFFLSQPGEWDSAGQAIWTLVEHYRLSEDRHFLESVFDPLIKGADWIVRTRKKENRPGPTFGLLPPGFSAEHFGPNDYYYWDDLWGAAGLRDVAQAAEVLGMRSEWVRFEEETERFLADIRASLGYVERRLGRAVMPAGPYRRVDSGTIGATAAVYPLRLFDPFDPLIENTLEALHQECMFDHGFFQNMIHSGINAYLTLHIAHCHVFRREARAWPLIKYVLAKATSVGTWPEAIHPKTGGGCMGDGMHLWAAADWLLIMRDLLLFEDGANLVLLPAAPDDWFEWGSCIEVHDAPTHFGRVSYRVEAREAEVIIDIAAAWRHTPLKIEVNLPFPIETALIDGQTVNVNDHRMFVPGGAAEIRIRRI